MNAAPDLLTRIDRLESRFAIAELVTAYALACDEHDMPRLLSLFTEDAAFDSPSGAMVARGRAAIEAMFISMFAIRGPAFHWTHDHGVQFDAVDANRASGMVLAHAETCPGGVTSLAAMRYYDDYRRVDGNWLFARREIRFLYYVPIAEYDGVFGSRNRLTLAGERRPADFPEELPAWQHFEKNFKAAK